MRDTDAAYKRAVDQADIVHADGAFIVALSRFRKGPTIPERSATTDLIHDAASQAERLGLSFMLIGGPPGLAERTKSRLSQLYPKLRIVGCEDGYFRRHQEEAVIERINSLRPDIIWVGLGKPREQQFCIRNKDRLNAGWLVTCGGCFHYITGDYSRAPLWMQRSGLEWLYRMATGPRSLWMRYITTNPRALYLAIVK
ncbi:MAG: WecB/TagA/CpsF family glycosyltransferase [Pseudorhizobium sp.]